MTAKRRGLGRGLDALLDAGVAPRPTLLPTERLRPNRLQPRSRFDTPAMAELVESIRSQGVVQPIIVTPRQGGGYTIIAGERRWRAARQAGMTEVPVVVREVESERDMLEMALVENLQRADLNPIEAAEAFERLRRDFGLSQEEIAARIGKSRSAVSNSLRLLSLPQEVQDLMREGALTAGQARPLLALAASDEQIQWARRAVREQLSARQLEAIGRPARGGSRRERVRLDPDTAAAAEELTKKLHTKVVIQRRGRGGRLSITFHSEAELMRLYDLLMRLGD